MPKVRDIPCQHGHGFAIDLNPERTVITDSNRNATNNLTTRQLDPNRFAYSSHRPFRQQIKGTIVNIRHKFKQSRAPAL